MTITNTTVIIEDVMGLFPILPRIHLYTGSRIMDRVKEITMTVMKGLNIRKDSTRTEINKVAK